VGYYTAQGMAVMAAQARSLGFSLVFSAQDLPALEKRVKEESRSITANCNIKIFGKLEDPTQTKEFFEKTVGSAIVMEASSFQLSGGTSTGSYYDTMQAGMQLRARASYDELRSYTEGQAIVAFGEMVMSTEMYYSNPGHAKAMRVTRYVALPPPDDNIVKHASAITKVRDLMVHKTWTAAKADVKADTPDEINAVSKTYLDGRKKGTDPVKSGMGAIAGVYVLNNPDALNESDSGGAGSAPAPEPQKPPEKPAAAAPAPAAAAPPPAQQQGGGGPMSFFAKKKEGDAPAEPQKEQQAQATPTNWVDLVNQTTSSAAPPKTAEPPRVSLPPEIDGIIKNAGRNFKETLFKDNKEDEGAAE